MNVNDKINELAEKISKLSHVEIQLLLEVLEDDFNVNFSPANVTPANFEYEHDYGYGNVTNDFNVHLLGADGHKLAVVKLIKEKLDLGLYDSKKIMDSAPCLLKTFNNLFEAERFVREFRLIGASMEIK